VREVKNETSPPHILASGRGHGRAAGYVAHCLSANLSDAPLRPETRQFNLLI
jgi:hypothetical protein